MAKRISLKCNKCGRLFGLSVGQTKGTTAEKVPDAQIFQRDGQNAGEFVQAIFDHNKACDGKIALIDKAFVD